MNDLRPLWHEEALKTLTRFDRGEITREEARSICRLLGWHLQDPNHSHKGHIIRRLGDGMKIQVDHAPQDPVLDLVDELVDMLDEARTLIVRRMGSNPTFMERYIRDDGDELLARARALRGWEK